MMTKEWYEGEILKLDRENERLRKAVWLGWEEIERLREQVVNLQTRNNALYETISILNCGGKLK